MHLAALENIFFFILIAVVGLVRWLLAAKESAKNSKAQKSAPQQTPNAPVQRAPAQTEEERVRRFMEALGVPTTNAPPQRRERRARTIRPIDPFPQPRAVPKATTVFVPGMPVPPAIQEVIASPPETTVRRVTPPVFEVRDVTIGSPDEPPLRQPVKDAYRDVTAPSPVRSERVSWQEIVRNPNGLRDAIILREIFGPPRGMQQNLSFSN